MGQAAITQQKKRLEYIDAAKALSIFMIMYGHITDLSNPVDTWMSSCKVCIFYVISGFLMAYSNALHKRTPWQFFKNICSTLAWPYFTFSVIAILVKAFYVFSKHWGYAAVIDELRKNVDLSVFLKGINSMWFLPTLFFGELIILALYKLPVVFRALYAVAGLAGFRLAALVMDRVSGAGFSETSVTRIEYLVEMLGKSIVAAWFIGFGYCFYLLMKRIDSLEGHYLVKLITGAALTVSNVFLALQNHHANFNGCSMGSKPFLFIYGSTLGSLGLILLLDVISHYVPMGWFSYWGKNSLILMCTHTALGFKRIAYNGWAKVAYIPKHAGLEYIIECFCVLLLLTLIMYGVIEFINKYLKFLTRWPGGTRKAAA